MGFESISFSTNKLKRLIYRRKKNKSYKLTLVNKATNIKVDGVVNDEQIRQSEIYGIDCISSLISEMQMEIKKIII